MHSKAEFSYHSIPVGSSRPYCFIKCSKKNGVHFLNLSAEEY